MVCPFGALMIFSHSRAKVDCTFLCLRKDDSISVGELASIPKYACFPEFPFLRNQALGFCADLGIVQTWNGTCSGDKSLKRTPSRSANGPHAGPSAIDANRNHDAPVNVKQAMVSTIVMQDF